MTKIIACLTTVVIFVVTAAFADTGWAPAYIGSAAHGQPEDYERVGFYRVVGENVAREHPSVRMADERVDIYLYRCGATVEAEFLFVNDGAATTVDMFYPLTWSKSTVVYDFELYRVENDGTLKPLDFDIPKYTEDGIDHEKAAMWAMPFESGEEIRVLCRYVAGYGWTAEGNISPRWQLETHEGHRDPDSGRIYGELYPYYAWYIIETGGAWKGPIGRGIIAFHTTDEIVWEDLINYGGKAYLNGSGDIPDGTWDAFKRNDDIAVKITGDSLVIEFDNIETGTESFSAVSDLLGGGLPISISGYPGRGGLEVPLKSSASSVLSEGSDYIYEIKRMGYDTLSGFHAWSEGVAGAGEGEWVKVELYVDENVVKPARLKGIHLYGGFHSNRKRPQNDLFYKNGAPSAVTVDLYRDDKVVHTGSFDLVELSAAQEGSFNVGSVYLGLNKPIECDEVRVTIDDVRAGSEWNDTCISEIEPVFADGRVRHMASSCLVESSSDICRFHPIKIDDGDPATCWAEGVLGPGVGEWVEMSWELPRAITGFTILPGFARDEGTWLANGRPADVKVELYRQDERVYEESFALEDVMAEQTFDFALGTFEDVDRCRFFIEGVYRGDKYDDTCISEIQLH
jgi:hypothetical protein